MEQAHYRTVFEIGLRSFPWGGLVHPLPFIVLGLLLLYFAKNKPGYRAFGATIAGFATLFFVILTVTYVPQFVESRRRAFRSGDSSVVEGVVQNFQAPPVVGGQKESFSVNGIAFSYYVGDRTPCFHNDAGLKGPIRPGIGVRIYYKDGCIQRVDVEVDQGIHR